MRIFAAIPGDEVIFVLKECGATSTDADPTFPGPGRHTNLVEEYVTAMENGTWEETDRTIILDVKTGSVWRGSDRTAAIAQVDWAKVRSRGFPVPIFQLEINHSELL